MVSRSSFFRFHWTCLIWINWLRHEKSRSRYIYDLFEYQINKQLITTRNRIYFPSNKNREITKRNVYHPYFCPFFCVIKRRLGDDDDMVVVEDVRGQIGFAISGITRSIVISRSNSWAELYRRCKACIANSSVYLKNINPRNFYFEKKFF